MGANDELKGWFAGRIPRDWFQGTPEVRADRDEIWVIGTLGDVQLPGDAGPEAANAARSGRIKQHREDTRDLRMQISEEAEKRFGRKVSWGARCGDAREMFTHLAVPAMTRLRLPSARSSMRSSTPASRAVAHTRSRGACDSYSRTRANGSRSSPPRSSASARSASRAR
jgi:hypothetical protein